jgi:ribosome-associated toxin RatA of RatAB toxin-antitoxin module
MASVHKSVLLPYSAQQMFDLVAHAEDYPKFIPWCAGATIVGGTLDTPIVRLDINYHGVRASFTTANQNSPPDRIVIELREGPFRRLDGTWRFRALAPAACKVELDLHYDFATPVLEALVGPVFNHIAKTFIDAFVKRAESVYTPSKS